MLGFTMSLEISFVHGHMITQLTEIVLHFMLGFYVSFQGIGIGCHIAANITKVPVAFSFNMTVQVT